MHADMRLAHVHQRARAQAHCATALTWISRYYPEFRTHLQLQLFVHMLKKYEYTIKVACFACYSIIMIAG